MIETIILATLYCIIALLPIIPLGIIAWHDLKTKTIKNWQLLLFGAAALPYAIYHWVEVTNYITASLFALVVYAILLALCKTKKMPAGDALLLLPFPLMFDPITCLYLLAIALIAHTIVSLILRKKETGAHAFAPSVFVAYICIAVPVFLLIPDIITALIAVL